MNFLTTRQCTYKKYSLGFIIPVYLRKYPSRETRYFYSFTRSHLVRLFLFQGGGPPDETADVPLPHHPAEDEHIHGSSPKVILCFFYVLAPNYGYFALRFGSVENAHPLRKAHQSEGRSS